ncbi:MAG TPA: hypothetical protein VFH17_08505 [Coriobacteriia bacterium]|nr:hypothetical protein [Coriobacteriia bacterium]
MSRWHVGFYPDGSWWTLQLWRLEFTYRPCTLVHKRHPQVSEAPGVWIFEWGYWHVCWWRRWIVWKDHECRWANIKRYDQFGTFARAEALT